ncbi:amidohydrolase family protein [Acuticoccus sp. M5D2P5]|uniref:metal-dependent hydrolase family protein n=1 Tax=Acuticoccus kalidii TaxID=2910977 RepID=UPI001F2C4FC0|nr:amidohydrolase family protein [Acuticoccus kalidii]MCF3933135.1 amidohydrolase family protein [Acuticoccus kalidii]
MSMLTIKNARIVDGSADAPTDPVDIVIEGDRFVAVGKGEAAKSGAGDTLDASGRIVMPGLIDCHVHVIATTANLGLNAELPNSWVALKSAELMKAMLMRGFTTVRDLGGADIGLKRAVDDGLIDAPRLIICGKALSQTGGHTDYRGAHSNRDVSWYGDKLGTLGRVCDGVDAVRRVAREELKNGADYVKVMADGGVSSPSDPIGYLVFSVDELKAIVEVAKGFGTYVSGHLYDDAAINRALDCGFECIEHGNNMSERTVRRVAEEEAFVVPTNITYDILAKEGAAFGLPPESVAKIEDVRTAGLECLTMLHREGVVMGYGSDLLGGMQPHQSGEFTLRGQFLPAMDVIRSATLDAARVVRRSDIGAIAPGCYADLLFVDGNPLDDLALLTEQGAHMPLIMKGGAAVKKAASV